MAKISVAQRIENKKVLDDIVLSLFWRDGWEGINYYSVTDEAIKRLGDASPVKRHSSLQNYYHCKTDFGLALKGKIFPVVIDYLSFSSIDDFIASWDNALNEQPFRRVVSLLVGNANSADTNQMSIHGTERLTELAKQHFGDENGSAAVETVLGRSILYLLNQ